MELNRRNILFTFLAFGFLSILHSQTILDISKIPALNLNKKLVPIDSSKKSHLEEKFSFKKDSGQSNPVDIKKIQGVDSLKKQGLDRTKGVLAKNKKVSLHGTISNQYDYGAIPYYMANNSLPTSLYKSSGTIKARAGMLPVIGEYFYANPKFISGLNNYYTIKFDVEEFQNLINNKNLDKTKALKIGKDSLMMANQKLKQQLALIQSQKIMNVQKPKLDAIKEFETSKVPNLNGDSLVKTYKPDSLKIDRLSPEDSLKKIRSGIDTSFTAIRKLEDLIGGNQMKITDLEEKIMMFEDPKGAINANKPGMPRKDGWNALSGIKKLEIGMCYPNYSTFLINQMALKGINFQYDFKKAFINTSVGKTVYTFSVQPTTSTILNQIQNLSNMFDWNANPNEKKIAAVKLGLGNSSKTYIGVGGLFGKGTVSPFSPAIKKNYVVEVDGRLIYEFVNIEAAVAKSFLQDNANTSSEILQGSQQTNLNKSMQAKIFGTVPKIKTKFSIMMRQVEPFFKSFGVGFMRSDIRRYEGRVEQPLGSKIKVGFNYRHDQDNLKNLHSISTTLDNYNYYVRFKIFKKRVDLNLNYSEIVQGIKDGYINQNRILRSNIKTIVCSYTPRLRKLISTNTVIYNLYDLSDGTKHDNLENIAFNSFNSFRKFQLNLTSSYNRSTITDSLNFTNALNSGVEIGCDVSEKVRILVGAKHSFIIPLNTSQYGYSGSINLALHKLFNVELKFEKLVVGDFINTLTYKDIQKFPYYGFVNLISKF